MTDTDSDVADAPAPTSAPRTARERARAELTREIVDAARTHLEADGAAGLSLRAVARDLGMVSSAIYRYFPSRDELLTALIIDAYDAVGEIARTDLRGRWLAIAHGSRDWALAHPQEGSLIYGSPVPGYVAPTDTIDPATDVILVFIRLLTDASAAGSIIDDEHIETTRIVRDDLADIRAAIAPGVPDGVLSRGLMVWMQLFGSISYELFGHFENVIHDRDAFFDLQMQRAGTLLFTGR